MTEVDEDVSNARLIWRFLTVRRLEIPDEVEVFGKKEPLGDATNLTLELARMTRFVGWITITILPTSATIGLLRELGFWPWFITMIVIYGVFILPITRTLWRLQDLVLDDRRRQLILQEGKRREIEREVQREAEEQELLRRQRVDDLVDLKGELKEKDEDDDV